MGLPLAIYHRLPAGLKNLAASGHGLQLRRRRYGPETDRWVQEAWARERWSADQWRAWQEARLAALLTRASNAVPYYRQHHAAAGNAKQLAPFEQLASWPVLRKEALRSDPRAFLAADANTSDLWPEHTSGTTGTPLTLWQSRATIRQWYALMEARWRGWNGVSRHDAWGILGGQLVVPVAQKKSPFWVWNAGLNQLYLSSYHLGADSCATYLEALSHWRVRYLWGYASSLYSLAALAAEQGLKPPPFRVVISNAEALYAHQRAAIAGFFGCPVKDTYGMSEMVTAASECEHGRLHLWPEAGLVEVLADDTDEPVPCGTPGRLICTGLLNGDMPLIRYEVGDRGALADPREQCPCGRTLPMLRAIEGREEDVILTPDGRRIGRLDPVFKAEMPVRESQIIQTSRHELRVLIVPGTGFAERHAQMVLAELKARVGEVEISLERVPHIPRSANGKLKAVVSRLGAAGRNGLCS